MALQLVPERHTGEDNLEGGSPLTLTPGIAVTVGKKDVDRKDGKLSKVLFRILVKGEEEAVVTRVGRTAVYIIPKTINNPAYSTWQGKGETGKLSLTQEGTQKNDNASSERVFLGDAVVVCGAQKKTLILLPAGQTWFEWAEGQRVREELRSLELQTLGGHSLDEEAMKRKAELHVLVEAGLGARADAASTALAVAAVVQATAVEAAGKEDLPPNEEKDKKDQKNSSAGNKLPQSVSPVSPPRDVTDILGEQPPEFAEGACGRRPIVLKESEMIKRNLAVLVALQEGEKLWVDLDTDLVQAQRGGGFSRMLYRQGRSVTAAWATRFHCKVRGFIEKEIVQLECGRGSPACMQEISKLLVSASAGLETLRRIYTGDMHTQNILGQTVKELALTAKMSQSYLARRKGETSRLVT